jgi:hypothetical protein
MGAEVEKRRGVARDALLGEVLGIRDPLGPQMVGPEGLEPPTKAL